jgi:hypothetical protein
MPTPRAHGGAALTTLPLTSPGFQGLNLQSKNSPLGPEWATKLQNAIIDANGRLAARKGWQDQTTTPAAAAFEQLIEYRKHDGTVELVGTTAATVQKSTDNGDTWSDVTGTAVFTTGNWKLVNFNDLVIGFQSGETPLLYNGTTSSQITDGGSEPDGGVGISAFGRLWAADANGYELKYCALLDHTDWSSADAGSFDLRNVWPGTDTIQGLAEYNGALVVFGKRNILIYVDGSGSALGIDPTNMYVVDTITGLGLASQFSIQEVQGDLWFLGNDYNLYSLQRVIQEKSAPIQNLSINVSDELRDSITLTGFDITELRSLYSPEERFYLLFLPRESAAGQADEVGITWVFDTRGRLQDGAARCMGRWTNNVATAAVVRDNGDLVWQLRTTAGQIGKYASQQDNGASFTFSFESGWVDLTQQSYELILKRINGLFYIDTSTDAVLKWAFDFQTVFKTKTLTFEAGSVGAEFGIGEFGIGEFSGGVTLREKKAAGRGTGEFIKLGVDADIDGGTFAVQQLDLYAKVGRLR